MKDKYNNNNNKLKQLQYWLVFDSDLAIRWIEGSNIIIINWNPILLLSTVIPTKLKPIYNQLLTNI